MRRLVFGIVFLLVVGCSTSRHAMAPAATGSTLTSAAEITTSNSTTTVETPREDRTTVGTRVGSGTTTETAGAPMGSGTRTGTGTPMGSGTTTELATPNQETAAAPAPALTLSLKRESNQSLKSFSQPIYTSTPSYRVLSPPITEKPPNSKVPHDNDGFLNFPPHAVMKQGTPQALLIQISPADIADKLETTAGGLRMKKEQMNVTLEMRADLECDPTWFYVKPPSQLTQRVLNPDLPAAQRRPAEWRFWVTPLKHGRGQQLTLKVYAVMTDQVPQLVLTKTQTIDVDIDLAYIAGQQWPWAGGLVAAIIGILPFKNWLRRRRSINSGTAGGMGVG